ncbi:MAG: hypothetical protein KGP29_02825 [Proteobacteria bacterium]|nr:hypothetical protein [Pseudomonadota bacterium]
MKIFQILFLVFLSTAAAAQGIDQIALNSVVQQIATGSGPVTKAEYDKFWQQLGVNRSEDKAKMIGVMKQRFVLAQEYQREVWICAEQAWNSHVVPRCENAQSKLGSLKADLEKTDSSGALSPLEDYSNNLLEAAAKRGSIQNPNGAGQVNVSLEMIKSTREGLDKMLVRFSQVLRPNY